MSTNLASIALKWDFYTPQETEEDLHKSHSGFLGFLSGTTDIDNRPETRENSIEDEWKAYQDQKAEIEAEYMGQYVAVYRGEVVESDSDMSTLLRKFYDTFGNKAVYIKKVGEPERVYKIRTPLIR